ncbi:MAG: hypothetical protein L6Q76_08200 [Polyangiaceae bacterium]|nr:hypothetical protein [Polyangiaceae bacterium]
MATFTLRHFSSAESLQAVQAKYLMDLLDKHAAYFATRGVDFGSFNGHGPDYEAIAAVLMTPDEQTPSELIDDLYYVDEMATADAMDGLLEAAAAAGVKLDVGDEPTPADVAVQVRLRAPALLEQKHAEHFLLQRRRTFEYFQSPDGVDTRYRAPGAKRLRACEDALGIRLEAMKRGRTCKLFVFPRPDGVWFLVRRGDPFKREGSIEKTGMTSVYYRPEKYDVLKYDQGLGELSVNAEGNKKLVALYRELFGELLFGDPKRFPNTAKYTLAPLQDDGADALICSDVEGIDTITLKEVQILWGGPQGEIEIRRAKDLFEALKGRKKELPKGRLVKASFLVRFTGQKTPRTVTIRPNNIASYTRNEDATLVEQWLALRGFVKTPIGEAQDADVAPAAAVA